MAYIEFLIWLFGESFFCERKNVKHQAYQDFHFIRNMIRPDLGAPLTIPLGDAVTALARITVASSVLSNASSLNSKDDRWELFHFGRFQNYGDAKAVKYIHDVKRDPRQYNTMFAELCVADWLDLESAKITSLEEEGMPDFLAEADELHVVECKKLHTGTACATTRCIKDSAKKFKRYMERYQTQRTANIIAIDATDVLSYHNPSEQASREEALAQHQQVKGQLLEWVQQTLWNQSSVDWVIFFWDRVELGNDSTRCDIFRGSELVPNPQGHHGSAFPFNLYKRFFSLSITQRPNQVHARSIRRISPCHCGSGKRFKWCHGAFPSQAIGDSITQAPELNSQSERG